MIDPTVEKVVPLNRARIPGNPHTATRWRWCLSGLKGGVKLESIKIGGVRYTSQEAVGRFIARLNADQPDAVPEPPNRRTEKAEAELIAKGC